MDETMKLLPLPTVGVISACYLRDMREVVGYDIHTDVYLVRYDWIVDDRRETFLADPIDWSVGFGMQNLMESLEVRRADCLKHRGIE